MGRPSLGLKPTVVRLSPEMTKRLDALVGQKRRARFIREAVEFELSRREGSMGLLGGSGREQLITTPASIRARSRIEHRIRARRIARAKRAAEHQRS